MQISTAGSAKAQPAALSGKRAALAKTHPNPVEFPAILAPIRCNITLALALDALRARDPAVVDKMLAVTGVPPLRARDPDLRGLAWIVIGQQVSVASATAIFARLEAGFPGVQAAALAAASDEDLRACGLSAPKMRTLRAIAAAALDGSLDFARLSTAPVETAHGELTALHGIGPWTADMFLLSCLGHPDAWPAGDLALQEAAKQVLGLRQRPDAARMAKIGERWRPARGVAARLLWAWYGALKARPPAGE